MECNGSLFLNICERGILRRTILVQYGSYWSRGHIGHRGHIGLEQSHTVVSLNGAAHFLRMSNAFVHSACQ